MRYILDEIPVHHTQRQSHSMGSLETPVSLYTVRWKRRSHTKPSRCGKISIHTRTEQRHLPTHNPFILNSISILCCFKYSTCPYWSVPQLLLYFLWPPVCRRGHPCNAVQRFPSRLASLGLPAPITCIWLAGNWNTGHDVAVVLSSTHALQV